MLGSIVGPPNTYGPWLAPTTVPLACPMNGASTTSGLIWIVCAMLDVAHPPTVAPLCAAATASGRVQAPSTTMTPGPAASAVGGVVRSDASTTNTPASTATAITSRLPNSALPVMVGHGTTTSSDLLDLLRTSYRARSTIARSRKKTLPCRSARLIASANSSAACSTSPEVSSTSRARTRRNSGSAQ